MIFALSEFVDRHGEVIQTSVSSAELPAGAQAASPRHPAARRVGALDFFLGEAHPGLMVPGGAVDGSGLRSPGHRVGVAQT
jgi:hypothetical protein